MPRNEFTISESSRQKIKDLIEKLETLDKKLETDGDRIQRDLEEYASLGLHLTQLTAIITDSEESAYLSMTMICVGCFRYFCLRGVRYRFSGKPGDLAFH
jgi:hypothetical protein